MFSSFIEKDGEGVAVVSNAIEAEVIPGVCGEQGVHERGVIRLRVQADLVDYLTINLYV